MPPLSFEGAQVTSLGTGPKPELSLMSLPLDALTKSLLQAATKAGADSAEAKAVQATSVSVDVRGGALEQPVGFLKVARAEAGEAVLEGGFCRRDGLRAGGLRGRRRAGDNKVESENEIPHEGALAGWASEATAGRLCRASGWRPPHGWFDFASSS